MLKPEELPHYTYSDYKLWEGNWELIAGISYAMTPSHTLRHQHISHNIARYLDETLDNCTHCRALAALDWIISDDTVVQPDNLIICHQEQSDFLTQAPVLIFEILSPSTAKKDRTTKSHIYEQEGVEWYCLVDPDTQVTKIYRLQRGHYIKQKDAGLESHTFVVDDCEITLDFAKIYPAK